MDAESKRLCDELTERFPAAENGPAHVVVGDYNLEDEFVRSALARVEAEIGGAYYAHRAPLGELNATCEMLVKLLAIPEAERCAWYGGPYAQDGITGIETGTGS